MAQTSRPDKTRNLPNLDLKPGDENLGVSTALNLRAVGSLKKQLDCFLQISPGFFDGIPLACDIYLGAQTDIALTFALDNGRQLLYVFHGPPVDLRFILAPGG